MTLFEEKEIIPAFEMTQQCLEYILNNEKNNFKNHFITAFSQACTTYKEKHSKRAAGILMLQLLRTDILEKRYRYKIVFYSKEWYLGECVTCGEIDTTLVFRLYHAMEETLLSRRGMYVSTVSKSWVTHRMNSLCELFSAYMKELILYSLPEATETPEYLELNRENQFQIRVGELMEPGDLVYIETKEKNQDSILKKIISGKTNEFFFQDWKGLSLPHLEIKGYDLRYCDFRGCNLEKSDFFLCMMTGSRMRNCNLRNSKIKGCILHDVDFSKSDLRGADLSYSLSFTGKDSDSQWRITGYVGGSFEDTDLRGANLTRCVFCGIDFTKTRLLGADFSETELYRCRMRMEQVAELNLTQEQQIHMEIEK